MTERFDVAVVGYGPVGIAMATLLGRSGHRVVVLERYAGLYNLPRAAIFDDETMRTFAKLGIAEELLPKLHVQRNYEWRNGAGELLIEHDFAAVGQSGWAEWYMMYQPDLENAINRACLATGNVDVRYNCLVTSYEQLSDGVHVLTEGADVVADYVVATDGGNSTTRRWLGIDQDDLGFSEPWMVCDFRLTGPTNLPMARQVCDPAQPTSIISLGPDHHRFSFMLESEAAFTTESRPELVWGRVAQYLSPANAELIRVATYTFRSLVAHNWRRDRILLAGDAAHQMPPFLGQGMCSGIRDAQNLAFKLDLILTGRAAQSLLDSYQVEREPHVRAVIAKGIELGRLQTLRDPEAAAARDRTLLAAHQAKADPEKIRFPGIGPGFVARHDSAGRGQLFPQGLVESGGVRGRFDEVLGYGMFLLLSEEAAATLDPETLRRASRLLDGVYRILPESAAAADATAVVDAEGVYASWLAEHRSSAVIVRPDFYVYGSAASQAELDLLLAEVAADIAPTTEPQPAINPRRC